MVQTFDNWFDHFMPSPGYIEGRWARRATEMEAWGGEPDHLCLEYRIKGGKTTLLVFERVDLDFIWSNGGGESEVLMTILVKEEEVLKKIGWKMPRIKRG